MNMTPMTVYPFRTKTFCANIYVFGTNSFANIPTEYIVPVMQQFGTYAADPAGSSVYNWTQLDLALSNGWITQQEYDDTAVYMPTPHP